MSLSKLGVCYYPEHWPEADWHEQARQMRELGIELVRIGEFAWSRLEPTRGAFAWTWLDKAIETLAEASLSIIMCTPTACPPKWLIDEHPDVLAVDQTGRPREFGSRRHYRFASETYRREARRICEAVIERYAAHPAIVGWQTDNEFGCHETTLSYSKDDLLAFRNWLRAKYADVNALNTAWGTVFWSQEYRSFDEIELPNLTVTEANPAHRLDYWRFASDQVVAFNADQTALLRAATDSHRWVTHNFMGNFVEFDHFDVGRDIDVASWDSYPLGFLDQGWASDEEKLRYRQIGHPDWAAFHHDLYRAVGKGRLAVMEQQPGPVNWAPSNALPLENAPAFWGMEAVAHGAEFVSFFRFRQLPVAQEQMHAALRLPTGEAAPAWPSVQRLAQDLKTLSQSGGKSASSAAIALLFDYPSCWNTAIQPHAAHMDTLTTALQYYSAARQLGIDIDIVSADSDITGYRAIVIPGTVFVGEALVTQIQQYNIPCLIGARSGSRQASGALPDNLAPGHLQSLLPLRVIAVDSMREGAQRVFRFDAKRHAIRHWFEVIDTELTPRITCEDGSGFWFASGAHHYVNAAVSDEFLTEIMREFFKAIDVPTAEMPEGLRTRRREDLLFVFNFSPEERHFALEHARCLVGSEYLKQGDYAVWLDD
ncbi:MAG: beta-galactosidase [Congregibacter sp.]